MTTGHGKSIERTKLTKAAMKEGWREERPAQRLRLSARPLNSDVIGLPCRGGRCARHRTPNPRSQKSPETRRTSGLWEGYFVMSFLTHRTIRYRCLRYTETESWKAT